MLLLGIFARRASTTTAAAAQTKDAKVLRLQLAALSKHLPPPPARPLTAYRLHTKDFLDTTSSSNTTPKDRLREAAASWATLSEAQKQALEERSKAEKDVYASLLQKFQGEMSTREYVFAAKVNDIRKQLGKRKLSREYTRDPGAPKRVTSAYMRFAATTRMDRAVEMAGMSVPEQGRFTAGLWNVLGQAQREEYKPEDRHVQEFQHAARAYAEKKAEARAQVSQILKAVQAEAAGSSKQDNKGGKVNGK
ncbi:MAG: hypothetical protein SGCHY_000349 [Lobulomycetales sp.]